MEYVALSNHPLSRRFFNFANAKKFNLFEAALITLITLTIHFVIMVCVGANSSLFCSLNHGSSAVSYINFQDYMSASYGNKLKMRIDESTRILTSVKSELSRASMKMKEIHQVTDDLNREIPLKQEELSQLNEEIAAAQRRFDELKEAKNVRVYLPHDPLFNPQANVALPSSSSSSFDFSRCSITSFLPVYLEEPSDSDELTITWHSALKKRARVVESKEKACITVRVTNGSSLDNVTDSNLVLISTKDSTIMGKQAILFHPGAGQNYFGSSVHLQLGPKDKNLWKELPALIPYKRPNFLLLVLDDESGFDKKTLESDILRLQESGQHAGDAVKIIRCNQKVTRRDCLGNTASVMKKSIFCALVPSADFQRNFWESLKAGCIPVVLSLEQMLPFQARIDWQLAAIRLPMARLPELHFILRSYNVPEIIELKRIGRNFFLDFLADVDAVSTVILSYLSNRLGLILPPEEPIPAFPLFGDSFEAKVLTPVNRILSDDDEFLGPLEGPVPSEAFKHNFSIGGMYSRSLWTGHADVGHSPEFLISEAELPTEAEFSEDTSTGFRPIQPGSGLEFNRALGGNRAREQFTIVIITYNRDAVLTGQLERLHKLPYLNKIVVIWNNVGREPVGAWPRLHVPVEFIKVAKNSLNNRFIPWDRIQTEALLSLDDDIDLSQQEIIHAFRSWRQERDIIVGFPARFHARFGDEMYYNSNHTCQYSMILTGAAFLHKSYLYDYTTRMNPTIREHVDRVMNCEDIAMNFLVAHRTRKPPLKVTSKWTIKCPTCTDTLSQDESHFQERHECIRLFTKIYGYNPLRFTQFRADSVLFKTRLPQDKQKCFRYV